MLEHSAERLSHNYHCTPDTPLSFLSVAIQKNYINIYHAGIYMKLELLEWFQKEFPKHSKRKLDMGKSCIRFKKWDEIPLKLIAEPAQKISPEEFISLYENRLKNDS